MRIENVYWADFRPARKRRTRRSSGELDTEARLERLEKTIARLTAMLNMSVQGAPRL